MHFGKALATIQIAIDQVVCTTGTCTVIEVTSVMRMHGLQLIWRIV